MNLADWHRRFSEQAEWTHELRQRLLSLANLQPGDRILEVGSGTGAVLNKIREAGDYRLTGIDIDSASLQFSRWDPPFSNLVQADGHQLPFQDACFDAVYCHYLLLWVHDPARVVSEMRRVTRPGGAVMALAEPDHSARIDAPPPLDELGRMQTESLRKQGAQVEIGRRLGGLFHQAGLAHIEGGIIGARWQAGEQGQDQTEWTTLQADLTDWLTQEELKVYQAIDQQARACGARVLFVPTFFAFGIVPK